MTSKLQDMLRQAHILQQQGALDKAEALHRSIVKQAPGTLTSWQFLSARSANRGDHKSAAFAIQQYLKVDHLNAQAWQGLGINLMLVKDFEAAADAFGQTVSLQPDNRSNLLYLGGAYLKQGKADEAADCLSLVLQQMAPADIQAHAQKAEPVMQEILLTAPEFLAGHVAYIADRPGPRKGLLANAMWRLHEQATPDWRNPLQRPERLYLPELAAKPFYSDRDIPWLSDLEAAFDAITAEVEAALSSAEASPYIAQHMGTESQWASLAGSKDWSAVHLYNGGKANEALINKFPNTLKALEGLPLCRVGDKPIEIFFSLLTSGTHIVPHYGTSNSRLTVHLPITVPTDGDCWLKVGDETVEMAAGKAIAFDDSFLHEAKNEGKSLRVNLIFEAWQPALSSAEQQQLAAMAEAYDDWFAGRGKRLSCLDVSLTDALQAEQAWRAGEAALKQQQGQQANQLFHQAVSVRPQHQKALTRLCDSAFAAGANNEGLTYLRNLGDAAPAHAPTQYRLAVIEEQIGEPSGAEKAYIRCLQADPGNMMAYLYAGYFFATKQEPALDIAAQLYSLGRDVNETLVHLHQDGSADVETRKRSLAAKNLLAQTMANLHGRAAENGGRVEKAVWPQSMAGAPDFGEADQRPHEFYIPAVKPIRFAEKDDMPWAHALEAAFEDIRTEFLAALSSDEDLSRPYLDAGMQLGTEYDAIKGNLNWAALDLYRSGEANDEVLERFPATRAALKNVPLVEFNSQPFEVFFSQLKPHQHIPPHFGLSNHGITVHLPIIVPEKCQIRVGSEWREWQEGKILAFDDSFDHEARNDSDELRVVLIFEVWHPDLTDSEIKAVRQSFNTRDAWFKERTVPAMRTS